MPANCIPDQSLQEEPMTNLIRILSVACFVLGLSAPFAGGQEQDLATFHRKNADFEPDFAGIAATG